MRCFISLALSLSLVEFSITSSANALRNTQQVSAPNAGSPFSSRYSKISRRDAAKRQANANNNTCVIDNYYNFVFNSSFGESVCRALMNYPERTVIVDTTPVSTVITTFTSRVITQTSIFRETPYTTVTVTESPARKRDARTTPAPRDVQLPDVFNAFRRQNAAADDANSEAMSRSFSSACRCQTYEGSIVTSTYTAAPTIVTLSAFDQASTTVIETRTAALVTITTTVKPIISSRPTDDKSASIQPGRSPDSTVDIPALTSSVPSSAPTAPAFTCPDDNNTTVTQLIGTMRYDYLILCDTNITESDFYGLLSFNTFSECAAACSIANTRLHSPVCAGFSYYGANSDQGYNCFLKRSANTTVPASGINSGVLRRVAVGISDSEPAGTGTETAPFVGETPTANPSQMSSAASGALMNRTTSISLTTPAPDFVSSSRLVAGQTSYSTYISNGRTYSTGTVFSTYHSASGTWYYSYYTSYSLAWSSATTVYAASESSSSIANTTQSETSSGNGSDGDHWTVTTTNTTTYFPGGYNVTQVISNVTYDNSGAEITSSATTNYYSYETARVGGAGGAGAGDNTAGIITAQSSFSTYTVYSGGGQTQGASSFYTGGVVPTPAPSVSPVTVINTYGTAYSSGFLTSGSGSSVAERNSTARSGIVVLSTAPFTSISSTSIFSGTSGETEYNGSGILTPISSTVVSTGTSVETGTIASGESPFTDSDLPRSGTYSRTSTTETRIRTPESSNSQPSSIFATIVPTGYPSSNSTRGSGVIFSTNTGSVRSGTLLTTRDTAPEQTTGGDKSITEYIPYPTEPVSYSQFPVLSSTPEFSLSVSSGVTFTYTNNDRTRRSSSSRNVTSSFTRTGAVPTRPSGQTPTGYIPTGTGLLSSRPALTGSSPSRTIRTGTGSILSGTVPIGTGSSGVPFTNTGDNRSRTTRTIPSGTVLTGTPRTMPGTSLAHTFPPYPTAASSCVTEYLSTTTIFTTVTAYFCGRDCPPAQPYGYGPLTLGPPDGPQHFG